MRIITVKYIASLAAWSILFVATAIAVLTNGNTERIGDSPPLIGTPTEGGPAGGPGGAVVTTDLPVCG